MSIQELWPVLIPGITMQMLIQVYYIRQCWKSNLNLQEKKRWIAAMVVFSLPAAAVYLITHRTSSKVHGNEFLNVDLDPGVQQGVFILLVLAYEIFALRMVSENHQSPFDYLLIALLAYGLLSMILSNLLPNRAPKLIIYLLPIIQLFLTIPIQYFDQGQNANFILILITAGIINLFPLALAKTFSIAAFGVFLVGSTAKMFQYAQEIDLGDMISYFYVNLMVFLLLVVAFYSLKKQMVTNRRLDLAILRVRDQEKQIQEMSALEERNRLAAEIHDTVGHSLTSAVLSIEASEKLIAENRLEALQKMSLAKEQVRRSLDDIRSSVRSIRWDHYQQAFRVALDEILGDLRKTANVSVYTIVELESQLHSVQQKVLLLAIKECITNALKHGQPTEIDLLLQEYKGMVHLTFSDNGRGAEHIVPGSGISIMRERVESIGGTFEVDCHKGEGCTVHIFVPVGLRKDEMDYEADSHFDY